MFKVMIFVIGVIGLYGGVGGYIVWFLWEVGVIVWVLVCICDYRSEVFDKFGIEIVVGDFMNF